MLTRGQRRIWRLCHVHEKPMNQSNECLRVSECAVCILFCPLHVLFLVCRPQATPTSRCQAEANENLWSSLCLDCNRISHSQCWFTVEKQLPIFLPSFPSLSHHFTSYLNRSSMPSVFLLAVSIRGGVIWAIDCCKALLSRPRKARFRVHNTLGPASSLYELWVLLRQLLEVALSIPDPGGVGREHKIHFFESTLVGFWVNYPDHRDDNHVRNAEDIEGLLLDVCKHDRAEEDLNEKMSDHLQRASDHQKGDTHQPAVANRPTNNSQSVTI